VKGEKEKEKAFFGLPKLLKKDHSYKAEKEKKEEKERKAKSEKSHVEMHKGGETEKAKEKESFDFFKRDKNKDKKKEKKANAEATADGATVIEKPQQAEKERDGQDEIEKATSKSSVPVLDLAGTDASVHTTPPSTSPKRDGVQATSNASFATKPQPVPQAFIKPIVPELSGSSPGRHKTELSESFIRVEPGKHDDGEKELPVPTAASLGTESCGLDPTADSAAVNLKSLPVCPSCETPIFSPESRFCAECGQERK
jgi:hypothetical protein